MNTEVKLTNLSQAGGCGCKIDQGMLDGILSECKIGKPSPKLVVGFENSDDCAVYQYVDEEYLLFTTDFFTPLVDDPYTFGCIAAANALSDVYSMGGKPLIANAILGVPSDDLSQETIKEIVKGGTKTIQDAGCILAGGHTIANPQPFYGFSILGSVEKAKLKTNSGAKDGDLLLLTKPLGFGICANAIKLGLLDEDLYKRILPFLTEVNTLGYGLGELSAVNALTDLTGFGLIGHSLEMAKGADLSIELDNSSIPVFEGVHDLSQAVLSPKSGAMKNFANYEKEVSFADSIDRYQKYLLCDPQSNGGLLISVAPEDLEKVRPFIESSLNREVSVIGTFHEKRPGQKYLVINNG